MVDLVAKWGIGEVWRVHSQIRLVEQLKAKYGYRDVYEWPMDRTTPDFQTPWIGLETLFPWTLRREDLLITFRALPDIIQTMLKTEADCLLLIGTNRLNLGVLGQRINGFSHEIYLMLKQLIVISRKYGLKVLEAGYFDCPFWPDTAISTGDRVHLRFSEKRLRKIMAFEEFEPFRSIRGHHCYVLGRKS